MWGLRLMAKGLSGDVNCSCHTSKETKKETAKPLIWQSRLWHSIWNSGDISLIVFIWMGKAIREERFEEKKIISIKTHICIFLILRMIELYCWMCWTSTTPYHLRFLFVKQQYLSVLLSSLIQSNRLWN